MRIPRVYHQGNLEVDKVVTLSTSASHHLSKVLRLTVSHPIILFNGDGYNYHGKINDIGKVTTVIIHQLEKNLLESSVKIHLGQVISKGDKMDHTMQKAVELGVSEVTPLFSARCDIKLNAQRLAKKQQHWQAVIINACQQCGRSIVPVCHETQKLNQWLTHLTADLKMLLTPQGSISLSSLPTAKIESIAVLIGCEGGFSEDEIALAKTHDFSAIQLGDRILRTETASVATLAILQYLFGDFN